MKASRKILAPLVITALLGSIAALVGCAQEDVAAIRQDVEAIKADIASLRTSAQNTETDVSAVKSGIEVLQVANLSDAGFNPDDANHAKDAPGRGASFTVQRISQSSIQMDVSVLRQPADKTLYLFLQVTQVGPEAKPSEWVRAGEIKTDATGRGALKVIIPRAPGVYQVGGIASNVDKGTAPYTGRVYVCVPSTRVQVTA